MLEAIFLMFLLALTAVFWSYPPLRNSEHRLCGVLRTAPSGCLLSAAVLVAVLLPPVRLPLAFGVGAALMAAAIWLPLLNFIRDKLKITSGRNSGWGYALGYLVLALLFAAVVLAWLGLLNPVIGALVHNAGSVLVIVNSALLLNWRGRRNSTP